MKTVAELIAELKAFPPGARCAAMERERVGLVIYSRECDGDGIPQAAGFVAAEYDSAELTEATEAAS